MKVDSIQNGIVIDHIPCGCGLKMYELLGLKELNVPIALLQNVTSQKLGHKDIIKIDNDISINLDVVGYLAPEATISIIKDGKLEKKLTIGLPETLTNVVYCKNPRCIVSAEQELPHIFKLVDKENRTYRCIYCETAANKH